MFDSDILVECGHFVHIFCDILLEKAIFKLNDFAFEFLFLAKNFLLDPKGNDIIGGWIFCKKCFEMFLSSGLLKRKIKCAFCRPCGCVVFDFKFIRLSCRPCIFFPKILEIN